MSAGWGQVGGRSVRPPVEAPADGSDVPGVSEGVEASLGLGVFVIDAKAHGGQGDLSDRGSFSRPSLRFHVAGWDRRDLVEAVGERPPASDVDQGGRLRPAAAAGPGTATPAWAGPEPASRCFPPTLTHQGAWPPTRALQPLHLGG